MKRYRTLFVILFLALAWAGLRYFTRSAHRQQLPAGGREPRLRAEAAYRRPRQNRKNIRRHNTRFAWNAEGDDAMARYSPPPGSSPTAPPLTPPTPSPSPRSMPEGAENAAGGKGQDAPARENQPAQDETEEKPGFPAITTRELPTAYVAKGYYAPLFAEGGNLPYSWKILAGSLPQGLSLNGDDGYISGIPLATGTYNLSLMLTDASGRSDTADYSLSVEEEAGFSIPRPAGVRSGPLYLTTGYLPEVRVGETYSVQLEAEGGKPPYAWSVSEGSLPAGIALGESSGLISGTAQRVEKAVFRIKVTDSDRNSDIAELFINVTGEELTITTQGLETGTEGEFYSQAVSASGGLSPYFWSVSSGTLHKGLALDGETGVISGTPEESGSFELTLRVSDAQGAKAEGDFLLSIYPASLAITTRSLPKAYIGTEYEAGLQADGGVSPYRWSIESGELPAGLSLSTTTGTISGIPSGDADIATFVVAVTDQDNSKAQRELSITVDEEAPIGVTGLVASPSDGKAALTWNNPDDDTFSHTVIVRNVSSYPADAGDGTVVYSGSGNSFLDTNLANGVTYYYTAIAYSEAGSAGEIFDDSCAAVTPSAISLTGPADPFADAVASFQPLSSGGFGAGSLPSIVLGPPAGGSTALGSLDVVSLHSRENGDGGATAPYGGSITLRFDDNVIVNAAGADFIVFENVFFVGGDPEKRWMEPAIVSVSRDGVHYYTFPYDFVPHYDESGVINLYNPYCYRRGFAGINPVYSSGTSPDPRDPAAAGGDAFDLSDITQESLDWVRYVRITATGDNWLTDMNGDRVRHVTEMGACNGGGSSGFDLDAVCAINY